MQEIIKKRLFSINEAGTYLGRSPGAIRELVYKGHLPCVKADKRTFLDVRDMDTWIELNKIKEVC
jgi:hypothetical protein